jgi:hypothetical protein
MATKSVAKGTTGRGKLLSFFRANGEWMAVVSALSSGPNDPVLSQLVSVAQLKGPQRRKAERWLAYLA